MNNENLSKQRKRAEAGGLGEVRDRNAVNRELSRQLCEICGLPYEKEIENELYRNMCNNGDPRCTQINRTNKATLNFEQPENFVKLLEINIDGVSLWWTINCAGVLCNENLPANRKEFLKMICRFIKNKAYIKQAIKDEEWRYE